MDTFHGLLCFPFVVASFIYISTSDSLLADPVSYVFLSKLLVHPHPFKPLSQPELQFIPPLLFPLAFYVPKQIKLLATSRVCLELLPFLIPPL